MQMLPLNFRWSFHSFIIRMCVLPATGSCGVNMVQVHSPSGVNSVNRWLRKSACCLIPDFCFNRGCGEGGKCWWKPERLSGAVGISGSDGGWGIWPELGRSWSWGGNCFNWQRVKYREKRAFIHSGLPSCRLFILPQQTPSFSLQVQNRGLRESSLSNIQRVAEILSSN